MNGFFVKRGFEIRQLVHGWGFRKRFANSINEYFVNRGLKWINGYMGPVLVKGLHILSMDPLLRGVSSFLNWHMAEALVKGFANFINGFLDERGF